MVYTFDILTHHAGTTVTKAVCIESKDVYAIQNYEVGPTDFDSVLHKFVG